MLSTGGSCSVGGGSRSGGGRDLTPLPRGARARLADGAQRRKEEHLRAQVTTHVRGWTPRIRGRDARVAWGVRCSPPVFLVLRNFLDVRASRVPGFGITPTAAFVLVRYTRSLDSSDCLEMELHTAPHLPPAQPRVGRRPLAPGKQRLEPRMRKGREAPHFSRIHRRVRDTVLSRAATHAHHQPPTFSDGGL